MSRRCGTPDFERSFEDVRLLRKVSNFNAWLMEPITEDSDEVKLSVLSDCGLRPQITCEMVQQEKWVKQNYYSKLCNYESCEAGLPYIQPNIWLRFSTSFA